MGGRKTELLQRIDRDRDLLLDFFRGFIRCPARTRPATRERRRSTSAPFWSSAAPTYRVIAPHPEMPNIVATFEAGQPGKHLVLNGHIDVFPVADDGPGWTQDPWGGELVDGKFYGRGAADMKCGTSASIWTYIYLSRIKDACKGV